MADNVTAPASPEAGRLTGEALEAIEARAAQATPGPWEFASVSALRGLGVNLRAPDADFITAAREDVPALCREVRRLQAALSEIEQEARTSFDESHFTGRVSGERFQRILNVARRALAHRPVSRTAPNADTRVKELEALLGRFAASAIASANNAQSIWLAQGDWDELRALAAPVAPHGEAR